MLAGALLVAGGVAVLLRNAVSLRASTNATIRSDRYLLHVVSVERLVVDAETGLRGYVITERTQFLAPLQSARKRASKVILELGVAAAANHAYGPQARAFGTAVQGYLSGYVPRVLAMAARAPASARTLAVTLEGKRLVDGLRAQARALERLVSVSQAKRAKAVDSRASHSIESAIVVLVLLTGLTLLLGAYLGHLAVARERARERSEATSRTLQESLVPTRLPAIPGCELAARFVPAGGGIVGGDFYDVFETSPGTWILIVGDVCGKGPAAAAVTAMARWTLHSVAGTMPTPEAALNHLNDVLLRESFSDRFITICYAVLSLGDGGARIRVACAGHPAPILVPRDGEPREVQAGGDVLGVWSTLRLDAAELELGPGDSLVAYTDGVTDQGPERAEAPEQALRASPASGGAEVLAETVSNLARHGGAGNRDDVAVVAVRFVGPAESMGTIAEAEPGRGQTRAPAH